MRQNKGRSLNKVIVRIKGGIGNQLFCYAAARRLALVNDAELVIDDVTGFARDHQYRRGYMLDRFNITARKATPAERLELFERYRRGWMKWLSRRKPFVERLYLERDGMDFDERLLQVKRKGTLYLDGVWQGEGYFRDVEEVIREDLRIIPPPDESNQIMSEKIKNCQAVGMHMRWFDAPGNPSAHNVSADYYKRATALMEERVDSPHYFVFSDRSDVVPKDLALPSGRTTFVSHNRGDEKAYADLWLMSQCRHFIIANSTFSWWGAWLAEKWKKIVVCPSDEVQGITWWGFKGLLPDSWIKS